MPKFDEKTAVSEQMWHPIEKADRLIWIKSASNYLIGRAPEMEHMLNGAEGYQSTTISESDVTNLCNSP